MATDSMEREAKLEVDLNFALPALNGVLEGVVASEMPSAELVATYHDTADRRLLARGITLRHRRDRSQPGDQGEWTVKLPGRSDERLLERAELSWPGDDSAVPDEASRLLRAIVRHAELRPLIRLITSRRRVEIRDPGGRPLAEVDDDTVAVMHGLELADRFREVEVELKAGDDELLDSLVGRLASAGAVPGAGIPKVARALGTDGVTAGPPSPELRAHSPLADVISAAVAAGVERLISHEVAVRRSGDPEDVHQARVATRRLRSDLRTFSDALDPAWTSRVRDGLRTVGAAFGRVRDADVLAERLWIEAAEQLAEVDREGLTPLKRRLAEEREEAYTDLLGVLDADSYLDLLDQLTATPLPFVARDGDEAGAGHLDPQAPAAEVLVPLVRRPWKKLRRAVAGLGDDPPDQELHQVRIRAKRLRYAAEAAEPVIGPDAKRLAKAAADLQDVLGAHHDAVTAEAWLRRQADTVPDGRGLFVTGQLVAGQRFEQVRLRQAWGPVWKALHARHLRHWLR